MTVGRNTRWSLPSLLRNHRLTPRPHRWVAWPFSKHNSVNSSQRAYDRHAAFGVGRMIGADPTGGALVVFGLITVALVLFVSEVIPNDVTALGIIVSLAALEPLTGVGHRAAISGFANTATVTIVAMYMLSAGVQRTGVVQRLGLSLAAFTNGS